ncbi:MAG TPA: serine hydrolase domain-containing protein [Terriglobia bacterium]|nr:serine hydrolase domain-containing protein [Terriglobia bacterium]
MTGHLFKPIRLLRVVLALTAGACLASSQQSSNLQSRPMDTAIRARVEALLKSHRVPGAAIAIIRNREVTYLDGFGLTGNDPSEKVTPSTIFQAASLSKPVFAYAVLELSRQGRLNLDAPLTDYLPPPYLHEQEPWEPEAVTRKDVLEDPRLQRITARMILTHSAGFPNWARQAPLTIDFEPGQKWSYSSEGYVYLQRVIEHIVGEPFEDIMRDMVFSPLHMDDSSFVEPHSTRAAAGHDRNGLMVKADSWSRPLASTSLYTSVRDYARFVTSFLDSGAAHVSLEAATSQTIPVDSGLGLSWGLGWGVEDYERKLYFFHWGANTGFQAFVLGSVDGKNAVVILTNGESGLDLSADLVQLILNQRHPLFSFYMLHPQ